MQKLLTSVEVCTVSALYVIGSGRNRLNCVRWLLHVAYSLENVYSVEWNGAILQNGSVLHFDTVLHFGIFRTLVLTGAHSA